MKPPPELQTTHNCSGVTPSSPDLKQRKLKPPNECECHPKIPKQLLPQPSGTSAAAHLAHNCCREVNIHSFHLPLASIEVDQLYKMINPRTKTGPMPLAPSRRIPSYHLKGIHNDGSLSGATICHRDAHTSRLCSQCHYFLQLPILTRQSPYTTLVR